MTRVLTINGTDLTGISSLDSIRVTGQANNGASGIGEILIYDDESTLYGVGPNEDYLRTQWSLTENASGSAVYLERGRIANFTTHRGQNGSRVGERIQWGFDLEDSNKELFGFDVQDFVRPEETDVARVLATGVAYLNGSPRASTNLDTTTYVISSNTVTLPAKTYTNTDVIEILLECQQASGKTFFVSTDHELHYYDDEYAGYQATLEVSDGVNGAPEPDGIDYFAPIYDLGPALDWRGQDYASRVRYVYADEQSVLATNATSEAAHDLWAAHVFDSETTTAALAQTLANTEVLVRAIGNRSYQFSLLLKDTDTDRIKRGQTIWINITAAADSGTLGRVRRRIAELQWEAASVDRYFAHITLDQPIKTGRRPSSVGKPGQNPKPAPEEVPDTPGSALVTWDFEGGGAGTTFDTTATYDSNLNLEQQSSGNCPTGGGSFCGYNDAGGHATALIAVTANTSYSVSMDIRWKSDPSTRDYEVEWYNAAQAFIGAETIVDGSGHSVGVTYSKAATVTSPANAAFVRIDCGGNFSGAFTDNLVWGSAGTAADNPAHAIDYGTCPHDSPHYLPSDYLLCRFDEVQGAIEDAGLGWFNVKTYGATGDGTTDDTTDINSAIDALNAAGAGVLYFPHGTYLVSSALTAITAAATILGDGGSDFNDGQDGSTIQFSSATATLFTINTSKRARLEKLTLANDTTATAGAAIVVTHASYSGQRVVYDDLTIHGFYIGIDQRAGAAWSVANCLFTGQFQYGLKVRNINNDDVGDWSISNSYFTATAGTVPAAIRIESSGGGKITNTKINAFGGSSYTQGIDLSAGNGISTVILMVSNCSIENVSDDGFHVTTTGTGTWPAIIVNGNEFGLWGNNSGYAVSFNAASAGKLSEIVVGNNVFITNGTARSAVELVNVDNVSFANNVLDGFDDLYDATTSTNVVEVGAGASDLDGLSDVAISTPANKQVLAHDGTDWNNRTFISEAVVFDNAGTLEHVTNGAGDDWLFVNLMS